MKTPFKELAEVEGYQWASNTVYNAPMVSNSQKTLPKMLSYTSIVQYGCLIIVSNASTVSNALKWV